MPQLDLNKFYSLVRTECAKHPNWRYGQVLFNTLHTLAPELANEVRGTDCDPFHFDSHDRRICAFTCYLDSLLERGLASYDVL